MASSNTLSDVTNLDQTSTPQALKVASPPPPPPTAPPPDADVLFPPPDDDDAPPAPPDESLRSILLNRLAPLTGAKRYAAVLGSGYATFAFFYFVHPLSAVLWIALAATLYNGCASVLGAVPAMREPISEESVTPMVVATLSAVVDAYEAVIETRKPRVALGAAIAMYLLAQTSGVLSVPTLAFLGFHCLVARAWWEENGRPEYLEWARTTALRVPFAENTFELASKLGRDSHGAVPLAGGVLVIVWAFFLGWFNKALMVGFAALVLKASGNDTKPSVQLRVKEMKKHARRMTMGAAGVVGFGSPAQGKAKAL